MRGPYIYFVAFMKKTYDGPMMQTTIHTLNTGITRLYLLKGSLGYILVDTGLHMSKERFEELFLECGVKASEISLIIVTHAHPDHYSGMKAIRELTEAPILAHKKALHTLVTGEIIDVHPRNECGRRFKSSINRDKLPPHYPYRPEILIDAEFDLSSFGIAGRLIPTPGHSDCCLSLLLDSGEAFINDIFTTSPYTGKVDVAIIVSDELALFESVKFLLKKAHIFYGAHGGPYTREVILNMLANDYPYHLPKD